MAESDKKRRKHVLYVYVDNSNAQSRQQDEGNREGGELEDV